MLPASDKEMHQQASDMTLLRAAALKNGATGEGCYECRRNLALKVKQSDDGSEYVHTYTYIFICIIIEFLWTLWLSVKI